MDWASAIQRNSQALKTILAALFAMLSLEGGTQAARLPRSLHSAILRVLRPAESAVRRLIVIAAKDLVAKPYVPRAMPAGLISAKRGRKRLVFRLIDPSKRIAPARRATGKRFVPRIHLFASNPQVRVFRPADFQPVAAPLPPPDGCVDSSPLLRRLEAVKQALGDLPRQAKRLARLRAKQARTPTVKPVKPLLRQGMPPGHRAVPVHGVDYVLAECHALARQAMGPGP